MPVFAAQPDRVAAARMAQRVGDDVRIVIPALRIAGRSPEVEAAGDNHLRQSDVALDAIADAEHRRIELRAWNDASSQDASAESRLIQQRRSEDVRTIDGQHASTRF